MSNLLNREVRLVNEYGSSTVLGTSTDSYQCDCKQYVVVGEDSYELVNELHGILYVEEAE